MNSEFSIAAYWQDDFDEADLRQLEGGAKRDANIDARHGGWVI